MSRSKKQICLLFTIDVSSVPCPNVYKAAVKHDIKGENHICSRDGGRGCSRELSRWIQYFKDKEKT
jgi:hypothetical protein